jgi:quercetin dioxygenase-like cupin family protein
MFYTSSTEGYKEALPGVKIKTLVYGEKTLLTELRFNKGSALPAHSHPHEQTGYLIEGKLNLKIAGEVFEVHPGDSWSIPSNAEHSAEVLEDTVVVEVFSPVREDYLPHNGDTSY